MRNFLAILAIFILMTALFLTILHVTGTFKIDEYILTKLKENPKMAEWFKTHDEVVALNKEIESLNTQITGKDTEAAKLNNTIKKLEKDLESSTEEIEALKKQISELEKLASEHNINVKEMAAIYGEMKPEKAAQILQGLENTLIIQILKILKKDVAAEILSFFSTETATEVTREFTLWEKN